MSDTIDRAVLLDIIKNGSQELGLDKKNAKQNMSDKDWIMACIAKCPSDEQTDKDIKIAIPASLVHRVKYDTQIGIGCLESQNQLMNIFINADKISKPNAKGFVVVNFGKADTKYNVSIMDNEGKFEKQCRTAKDIHTSYEAYRKSRRSKSVQNSVDNEYDELPFSDIAFE